MVLLKSGVNSYVTSYFVRVNSLFAVLQDYVRPFLKLLI